MIPTEGCVTINIEAMPLASVKEWRARIGSSWCALGRPFKASKSPGNYRSLAALSGSAMLQAICALMVMVLALTRATTIEFIRGAKSVNGCVNDCRRQIKSEWRTMIYGVSWNSPLHSFNSTMGYIF